MRKITDLRGYQKYCIDHILENEASGLFLDMGLGKTVSALTAIDMLLYDSYEVKKVLVVAPLRVAQHTWTSEVAQWAHLRHLKISRVIGSEAQRKKALAEKADIFIINRENLVWLTGLYGTAWPFDMVVVDELSSFKSAKAARFKALRKVRPFIKRMVGLTGTPAPNGLIDLWPQLYLLDQGQRLEKTLGQYRERYFSAAAKHGHIVTKYKLRQGCETAIYEKIKDICISMKGEDYITLPALIDENVNVEMDEKTLKRYREFEESQILAIVGQDDINAVNAGALTGKLLQFTNGAVYDEQKEWHEVHQLKLDALEELVEEANGKPVMVFYWFKSDLERIKHRLREYKPVTLDGEKEINQWNAGEISVCLVHPMSAGHGLNLQDGGNTVIWFCLPWSLEYYQQGKKRIHRSGQKQIVTNYHIVIPGTIEDDVIRSLHGKNETQNELMDAVKVRIETIRKKLLQKK